MQMEHLLEMTNDELQQWTTQHEFTAAVKVKLRVALTKFRVRVYYLSFFAKFSRSLVVL